MDASRVRKRKSHATDGDHDAPPVFTIDLSLPPRERYRVLASSYRNQLRSLSPIFEKTLRSMNIRIPYKPLDMAARLFMRRLNDAEQTEELLGISDITETPMHILVVLNTFLDLLMGCTSGAAKVSDRGGDATMVHIRTLDWSMDSLRPLIVHLQYVRGGSKIAEAVTYAGFVGVLTGVRRGLSISLNFRGVHTRESWFDDVRFYGNHLMVILGIRPSIASTLRNLLLSSAELETIDEIADNFESTPTTAAYIILCDGQKAYVLEKEFVKAAARTSDTFIVATNHDESNTGNVRNHVPQVADPDIQWILDDSRERSQCVSEKWQKAMARKTQSGGVKDSVQLATLLRWVRQWPTTNESTHFSCVMDPITGRVLHCRRYLEPPVAPDS